ncbi:hypothetical protein AB4Z32_17005 [Massilia sp. 2TAF26]|uniref:hypothetical protein n=1 Tax=Massilia sp. 2TAF26 TaxID=3233012 RepID=UPI003F98367A
MNLDTLAFFFCSLWAGIVLGISFVAQPAKFGAPGLTRPVALSVGRRIFRALHWTEIVIALGAFSAGLHGASKYLYLIIASSAILTIQVTLLMPRLSKQVDMVLTDSPLNKGHDHAIYAVLEFAKVGLLISYAFLLIFI